MTNSKQKSAVTKNTRIYGKDYEFSPIQKKAIHLCIQTYMQKANNKIRKNYEEHKIYKPFYRYEQLKTILLNKELVEVLKLINPFVLEIKKGNINKVYGKEQLHFSELSQDILDNMSKQQEKKSEFINYRKEVK